MVGVDSRQREREKHSRIERAREIDQQVLNVGAWNPQGSGRKAPLSCNAAFSMLHGSFSAFLRHAFREVTCGFCKGTVPGAPPLPSPGPLRMPKNKSEETYLVPPEGHISVKNMWSDSQVVQRYRTRGAPFPLHKAPRMPKNTSKKTYSVPGPKARLRQGTFEKPRVFRLLQRSFWSKWHPHCRKANVAVQLLQRSTPKTAAQLPFSLVACCRGGV